MAVITVECMQAPKLFKWSNYKIGRHDSQRNAIRHNDTQHNILKIVTLSITAIDMLNDIKLNVFYVECHLF
jgi:hypothetical protein